jgi:glucose/arabinose dehydrogenase
VARRAGVAELADAPGLGPGGLRPLEVRFLSPALLRTDLLSGVAAALLCVLLTGCGAAKQRAPASNERIALAVHVGNGGPPFDVTRTLVLPAGWTAEVWARVPGARFAVWTPEGALLVSRPQAGTVVRLEPRADSAAPPRQTILVAGLTDPHGLAFDTVNGRPVLYVAESDKLDRYAWKGERGVGTRTVVARDLPDPDGIDRLKGIAVGPDHTIYVSVGSMSEGPGPRAVILAYRPGGARLTFARGVRNGEGLSFDPDGALWAAANAGEDVAYPFHRRYGGYADAYGKVIRAYTNAHPADELAKLSAGRNLGWPYCNPDDRLPFVADVGTNPNGKVLDCRTLAPVERTIPAHSAPLGFRFLHGSALPAPWSKGAVVAVHGSFDPPELRAPAVLWLPWTGKTLGEPRTLVGGFQLPHGTRWGRPADAIPGPDGALYVTDDTAGAVYRLVPPRR